MVRGSRRVSSSAAFAPLATLAAIAISLIACGFTTGSTQATQAVEEFTATSGLDPTETATSIADPATATATPLPSPTPAPADPTVTPPRSPTSSSFTVTASAGNLTIRRGPGLAYDSVGFLLNGVSAAASGKSSDGGWLYVENPDKPGGFGWVSARSRFLSSSGDPTGLPVMAANPPQPSFLRNCTFHPMKIIPGEMVLKEQFDAPNNRRQLSPGTYEAFDMNQEGIPKVLTVDLREGQAKDIVTDGLGNTYACP